MSFATKLAVTCGVVGWVIIAFATVLGIATISNAVAQTIAIYGMVAGGSVLGAGVLLGLVCFIMYIWE